MSQAADDPGWPSVGSVLLMTVPGAVIWRLRNRQNGDPLVLLRAVFLSFSLSLVVFGAVLASIPGMPNGPVVPWVPVLVVVAGGSVVGVQGFRRRPLDCTSETTLAMSYRTRFFATVALTDSVALFAFTFAFIGGPAWIYEAGAAFAIFRLWTTCAPTRSALVRDQDVLREQGCDLVLVDAIRSTPVPPRGRRM